MSNATLDKNGFLSRKRIFAPTEEAFPAFQNSKIQNLERTFSNPKLPCGAFQKDEFGR